MELFIPPELKKEELAIQRFFDAMIYKLRKNTHKAGFSACDVPSMVRLMDEEVDELRKAIEEGNSVEILLEAADTANFAMIAATAAIEGRKTKEPSDGV